MCKLQGCARHVFVEEVSEEGGDNLISDKGGDEKNSGDAPAWSRPKPRGRVHEFCGWRHRQDYTMLQAYSLREQQSPPLHKDGDHPSSSSLIKVFPFLCSTQALSSLAQGVLTLMWSVI